MLRFMRICLCVLSIPTYARALDLASLSSAHYWVQHSVVGGPSWDAFSPGPHNPVYVGTAPLTWVLALYDLKHNPSTPPTPLPVELLSFNLMVSYINISIRWSMASSTARIRITNLHS